MVDVDAFVAASVARVDKYSAQAETFAKDAVDGSKIYSEGMLYYGPIKQAELPGERPAFNPNADLSIDFRNGFADAFGDFHADMLDGLADYMAKFFPECITTHTDNWICTTILTGGTGIPADVEAAIWQRGRDRETAEFAKLEADTITLFAQRGFTLPPGALAARLMQIQQDATNKAVDGSRAQTIETLKVHIEQVKFAVEQGVKVRLGVLGALGEYLKAWMAPQLTAAEHAKLLVDSKQKLWASAADYYRAMIQEAELTLSHHKIMAPSFTDGARNYLDRLRAVHASQLQTALSAATTMGQIASTSAGSTNTIVGGEQHDITSTAA